jgi:alkanesulfonate monooxygenase SsuD/methylene tetrahydromethanopterin reductase-like flavin-dependent oxidoreductase (luciferase family)
MVSKIEVGVDSFAAAFGGASRSANSSERLQDLIKLIERADQVGPDVFGIGEHHREDFLDSAPALILAAAAARMNPIRLTSTVTVLSAADRCKCSKNLQPLIFCLKVGQR